MECVVVGSSSCCCSTSSSSSKAAHCLPSGRPSCATFVWKGRNSCPEIRLLLSTSKTQQRQERSRKRRGATTISTTTRCSLSGNGNAMLHVMTVHQLTDWLTKQGFPEQVTTHCLNLYLLTVCLLSVLYRNFHWEEMMGRCYYVEVC